MISYGSISSSRRRSLRGPGSPDPNSIVHSLVPVVRRKTSEDMSSRSRPHARRRSDRRYGRRERRDGCVLISLGTRRVAANATREGDGGPHEGTETSNVYVDRGFAVPCTAACTRGPTNASDLILSDGTRPIERRARRRSRNGVRRRTPKAFAGRRRREVGRRAECRTPDPQTARERRARRDVDRRSVARPYRTDTLTAGDAVRSSLASRRDVDDRLFRTTLAAGHAVITARLPSDRNRSGETVPRRERMTQDNSSESVVNVSLRRRAGRSNR